MRQKFELLNIFTDGGSRGNPGPAAIGILVLTPDKKILFKLAKQIGSTTNNQAEYTAVLEALYWLFSNQDLLSENANVNFFLDSSLIVNQLKGKFKIKNKNILEKVIKIKELERKIPYRIFYNYIPRSSNKLADSLVNSSFK